MTTRTPPAQQPKEHCDHEHPCRQYNDNFHQQRGEACICKKCIDDTRSRPSPAPALSDDYDCDTCFLQDPCFSQFDKMPACSRAAFIIAKRNAASRAREDILDLIDGRIEGLRILFQTPKDERTTTDADLLYAINEIKIIRDCVDVETLRTSAKPREQEGGR